VSVASFGILLVLYVHWIEHLRELMGQVWFLIAFQANLFQIFLEQLKLIVEVIVIQFGAQAIGILLLVAHYNRFLVFYVLNKEAHFMSKHKEIASIIFANGKFRFCLDEVIRDDEDGRIEYALVWRGTSASIDGFVVPPKSQDIFLR